MIKKYITSSFYENYRRARFCRNTLIEFYNQDSDTDFTYIKYIKYSDTTSIVIVYSVNLCDSELKDYEWNYKYIL